MRTLRHPRLAAVALVVTLLVGSTAAIAAPQAHILRLDPRAARVDGEPVLTSVVELVQHERMSEVTSRCTAVTGNLSLDCVAERLLQPRALYSPVAFPDKTALFAVSVDGVDRPATFLSAARWGDSKQQRGVGTAWLILVDAAGSMGRRLTDARALARAFIEAMGPQDIVDVMFFNDRAVVKDSKWMSSKQRALEFVDSVAKTYPRQGRTRPLLKIIRTAATDGFQELGSPSKKLEVPMHQAMVVLSSGASGADPHPAPAAALVLRQYMTKGRFRASNQDALKMPVPVVSVWLPIRQVEEFFQNSREFMTNLANPEIGGFFNIVREGKIERAGKIVSAVRGRFDEMHVVRWRVPCLASSGQQTFKLVFRNTNPPIAGDTFIDVPLGIDASLWPLDVDVEGTKEYADEHPIVRRGTIRILGRFCWGKDHRRARLHVIRGYEHALELPRRGTAAEALAVRNVLANSGLVVEAVRADETFVEFAGPGLTKLQAGAGKLASIRLVVVDTGTDRMSAVAADQILTPSLGATGPEGAAGSGPPAVGRHGGACGSCRVGAGSVGSGSPLGGLILGLVGACWRRGGRRGGRSERPRRRSPDSATLASCHAPATSASPAPPYEQTQ